MVTQKRFALCYRTTVCLSVTLLYCGQTVRWINMKLDMQVGLGPGHVVLDGDPAPPRKGAQLVCAVSPAGFCHISTSSLDVSASWTSLIAIFGRLLELMVRPMLQDHSPVCNVGVLWPNGWKHQSATWYGARPWPRRPCVRWGSSSLRGQGYCSPSHFSSPCLLWPNSHPSQQLRFVTR